MSRPTRVVISIYDHEKNPHYGGGGATVVHELASRLSLTHDVTVVSATFPGWRDQPRRRYQQRFLRVGWSGPRTGQALFHAALLREAQRIDYDLWVESFTPPFSTSFLPLVSGGRPVVGLVQMLAGEDSAQRYRLPFTAVERLGLRQYDRFLVLNDVDRHSIERANPRARCVTIRNGTHLPPTPTTYGDGDYLLYLGRLDVRQKGLDLLLEGYSRTSRRLPLLLAGAGWPSQQRQLADLLRRYRVPATLVGHVSGPAKEQLLRRAAAVAMPSRYETFGLAALEAMAHGRPVVHFDLPRLDWIPPDAGIRVPGFDVGALARALEAVQDDPAVRARLGRRARREAEAYDWKQVGKEVADAVAVMLTPPVASA